MCIHSNQETNQEIRIGGTFCQIYARTTFEPEPKLGNIVTPKSSHFLLEINRSKEDYDDFTAAAKEISSRSDITSRS